MNECRCVGPVGCVSDCVSVECVSGAIETKQEFSSNDANRLCACNQSSFDEK